MFHRHIWYPVSVQSGKKVDSLTKGHLYDFTRVLYNCRNCHDVKTEEVKGHWTLEQIKGEV
jgi:hypothetical protein